VRSLAVVHDPFAVQEHRAHLEPTHSRDDTREALGPVGATAREDAHLLIVLPWRAKLAYKPCRNRWQLQRINLIAFQAPKRARPFTVNRQHRYHQAAAVLASPR
jgi:hypothetical protein